MVTVSLRPMCHVVTKRTLAVMGLVIETQALFDDLSENGIVQQLYRVLLISVVESLLL